MIGHILGDRPNLARSACFAGQEPLSVMLRMMANLIAERVPVDLSPLFDVPRDAVADKKTSGTVRVVLGGAPFQPPLPPAVATVKKAASVPVTPVVLQAATTVSAPSENSLIGELARSQQAHIEAHAAFLAVSDTVTRSMAQALGLEMLLRQALGMMFAETPPGLLCQRRQSAHLLPSTVTCASNSPPVRLAACLAANLPRWIPSRPVSGCRMNR
jgi:hypothetical protein